MKELERIEVENKHLEEYILRAGGKGGQKGKPGQGGKGSAKQGTKRRGKGRNQASKAERMTSAGLRSMRSYEATNKSQIDSFELSVAESRLRGSLVGETAAFEKREKDSERARKRRAREEEEWLRVSEERESQRELEESEERERSERMSMEDAARQLARKRPSRSMQMSSAEAARINAAARVGTAKAASKFTNFLLEKSARRATTAGAYAAQAAAAHATVLKNMSAFTLSKSPVCPPSPSMVKVRNTIVQAQKKKEEEKRVAQEEQDEVLAMYLTRKRSVKVVKGRERMSADDYLPAAGRLLADAADDGEGEEKEKGGKKVVKADEDVPMLTDDVFDAANAEAVRIEGTAERGGVASWSQEPLVVGERVEIRMSREGDHDCDERLSCAVWCDVVSDETVEVVVRRWREEGGNERDGVGVEREGGRRRSTVTTGTGFSIGLKPGENDADKHTTTNDPETPHGDTHNAEDEKEQSVAAGADFTVITLLQRIPKLVIVNRDSALAYTRQFLKKLVLKKNLLTFEQIHAGSIVHHTKRGRGVVTAIDNTTRARHVKFGNGDVHRYLEASWYKVELVRAEGVPHDGLWEKGWTMGVDLETDRLM